MRVASVKFLNLLIFSLIVASCNEAAREPVATESEPAFYRSLAAQGAGVDENAAREMISLYRRNNGLSPLIIDPKLQRVAQAQASAMAQANSLGRNVRGSLQARLASVGLPNPNAVENVSAGYHTLAEAFSGWRQSRSHNRNLLERRAARMGIATAYAPGTKYKVFWALILTD
jgi:uncharacterized protein YkwD